MKPAPSTTPKPTGIEAKILFARFYESIKAFYEDPENRRRFEEWQKARESETKKCQMSANYKIFTRKTAEKGVTPYRVSKETGISGTVFSEWKSGRSKPKIDKLIKLAEYFGCDVMDFYK